jgi:hypothetical protein
VRAREFLIEKRVGKIGQRRQAGTRGLGKFRDPQGFDRIYELNRVMMAVACADGSGTPLDLDTESWAGRYNTAHPYTDEEAAMLKQALQSTGSEYHDLNHGDMKSGEVPSTNTNSPVIAFKGYPR